LKVNRDSQAAVSASVVGRVAAPDRTSAAHLLAGEARGSQRALGPAASPEASTTSSDVVTACGGGAS
jgi:hypothetical protein